MGNAEAVYESTRVQLCGTFAVELSGQRVDDMLPGRQGRLLFAYLALSRLQPVSRSHLIDALWGDDRPADAGARSMRWSPKPGQWSEGTCYEGVLN